MDNARMRRIVRYGLRQAFVMMREELETLLLDFEQEQAYRAATTNGIPADSDEYRRGVRAGLQAAIKMADSAAPRE